MRAAILAFALLSACADDFIFLPSGGLPSLLLIEVERGAATATAYDLSGDDTKLERPIPSASVTLYALFFAERLDQIGFAPGSVEVGLTGMPLPSARAVHRFAVPEWIVLTAPPDEIANLRLPVPDPCAAFTITRQPFPFGMPTFGVSIDADRLLVGTEREELVIVSATGAQALPAGTAPTFGAFAHGGDLWLAGPGTRVMHGHPDRGFVDAPPLPFAPNGVVSITGPRGDAPFELFAADGSTQVAHFDGVAWTQIRAKSRVRDEMPIRPGMAWIEPGLAVLIGVATSTIVEITAAGVQRSIELMLPPRTTLDTAWTAAWVEGVGLVIGTRYDVLFRRGGRGWLPMAPTLETPRADVILDLGNATFMAGGQGGRFVQWGPGDFMCRPTLFGAQGVTVAGPIGDGVAIIASEDSASRFTTFLGSRVR